MINSEQYVGHSAIFIEPTPVHIAKLFGLIFMVDSICGRKDNINAVPFNKARPENWLNRHCSDIIDWQEGYNWKDFGDTEIINTIEHRYN